MIYIRCSKMSTQRFPGVLNKMLENCLQKRHKRGVSILLLFRHFLLLYPCVEKSSTKMDCPRFFKCSLVENINRPKNRIYISPENETKTFQYRRKISIWYSFFISNNKIGALVWPKILFKNL